MLKSKYGRKKNKITEQPHCLPRITNYSYYSLMYYLYIFSVVYSLFYNLFFSITFFTVVSFQHYLLSSMPWRSLSLLYDDDFFICLSTIYLLSLYLLSLSLCLFVYLSFFITLDITLSIYCVISLTLVLFVSLFIFALYIVLSLSLL